MRYNQFHKRHSTILLMMMSASFTKITLSMSFESGRILKNFFDKLSLILKFTFLPWRKITMRMRFATTFVKFTLIFSKIIHRHSLLIGFCIGMILKTPSKNCRKYYLILISLCSFSMTAQMSGRRTPVITYRLCHITIGEKERILGTDPLSKQWIK